MSDSPQNINSPLFTNPLETFPGLSIDDLTKYLPAIRTVEDMSFSIDQMEEGLFLAKCLDGLKQLPDNSIDLIMQIHRKIPGILRKKWVNGKHCRNITSGTKIGWKNPIAF